MREVGNGKVAIDLPLFDTAGNQVASHPKISPLGPKRLEGRVRIFVSTENVQFEGKAILLRSHGLKLEEITSPGWYHPRLEISTLSDSPRIARLAGAPVGEGLGLTSDSVYA